MKFWQIFPISNWQTFKPVYYLQLVFEVARVANAIILTKDSDFIDLVCRLGTPP